jgi:long-chain fatty acid transport protein
MNARRSIAAAALGLLLALAAPVPGRATNGMFLTSYGAETAGRGGANIALSDRSLGLNSNPAGISQLQGRHFSTNLALLDPSLTFADSANGTTDAEPRMFPLPAFAYVRSGSDTPWALGFGLVAQGGMGATFNDLATFAGTRDQTRSEVRFVTFSPTVAYSFSDDMALGLTLNIGYADASFRFFPETSYFNAASPADSFFGVKMDPAAGLQTSARLGWWWRAHPRFSVGAIYQTETDSRFRGGDMTVNFAAHPQIGRPVHYDARIDGFTFAAQAGAGVAYRPTDSLTLAVDLKRYFWDHAIDTVLVTGSKPDVAGAPPVSLPFVFDWRDQWVVAAGAELRLSDRLTLRAGYNEGENPVPSFTLTPLFPATVERHATLGVGWLHGNQVIDLALERGFGHRVVNGNTDPRVNPFGPGAAVDHQQWTLSTGISWAWDRR